MSAHDAFAEAIAAYALDALDPEEARRFKVHLDSCVACQKELSGYRQVTMSLGLAIEPETPPSSLKQRTLDRATAQPQNSSSPLFSSPRAARVPPSQANRPIVANPGAGADADEDGENVRSVSSTRRRTPVWQWLALAASLAAVAGLSYYVSILKDQAAALQQQLADASERTEMLRVELASARGDAERLMKTTRVVNAPDLITVNLRARPGAPGATAHMLLSGGTGLIFRAGGLPALPPGRVYQLWVIPPATPDRPAAAIGAGILNAGANGEFLLEGGPLPSSVPAVQVVAVTNEPGPAGSPAPTTPILLAGLAPTS